VRDYYGAMTPLKQLSGISTPDASTILISPFDKTSIKAIEKAINESDVSGAQAPGWLLCEAAGRRAAAAALLLGGRSWAGARWHGPAAAQQQ
jgi:hypothetical protein